MRFFSTVDLVNALELEKVHNRSGSQAAGQRIEARETASKRDRNQAPAPGEETEAFK